MNYNTVSTSDFYWQTYIKNPLKHTNRYFSTYQGLYKIVEIKLHRHFSYVEMKKVKPDGELTGSMIYLSSVGNNWEETNKRLAARIDSHINQTENYMINLGEISC